MGQTASPGTPERKVEFLPETQPVIPAPTPPPVREPAKEPQPA